MEGMPSDDDKNHKAKDRCEDGSIRTQFKTHDPAYVGDTNETPQGCRLQTGSNSMRPGRRGRLQDCLETYNIRRPAAMDRTSRHIFRLAVNMNGTHMPTNDMDHIVLDGTYADYASKFWMRVLRCGVVFRVEASALELEDTQFYRHWQTIVSEAPVIISSGVLERWNRLRDLLLETSLPIVKDLAPEVPRDRSLRASYHTTTYHLQLTRVPESQAVQATVTRGPVDESPYNFQSVTVDDINALAAGIPQYDSRDLEIVEAHASLSIGPCKVRTPDGVDRPFKACTKDNRRMNSDRFHHDSNDIIRAHLQLH